MAKAKSTKVKSAEWKGYHNVNLTAEQNQDFEDHHLQSPVGWDEIGILANNGYKFSVDWDDNNSGVKASLYAKNAKMDWAGYTLTAWAGDAETATKLLLYKHYVVCQQQWEVAKDHRAGASLKWG